jgi:hypothetical protein
MSLLDYANAPEASPSPLPPQSERRRSADDTPDFWPVGLLPHNGIADDLARRGLTYRRTVGYALGGVEIDPARVGHLAVDVLDEAPQLLAWHEANAVDDDTRERLRGEAYGLAKTARTARSSTTGRRHLLTDVRAYLPTPETADPALAADWLAEFDETPTLARPQLWRDYVDALRPGGLSKAELFDLAAGRWGAALRTASGYEYRPSKAARVTPAPTAHVQLGGIPANVAEAAHLLNVDPVALAAFATSQSAYRKDPLT